MTDQEKKDKRFGTILTAAIHVLVLGLFFFLVAWREPDPPIPEYGIELNMGFVEEGGGDQENDLETEAEETEEDTPPDAEVETENNELEETDPTEEVEETVEEVVEETIQETDPTEAEEVVEETPPPVEEVTEEAVETQEESTVKVEEKKEEVVEEVEEKKEETPPPVEKKEEVKPKPKPKPVVNSRALMGGKKSDNQTKDPASNNQGTYPDKKGNEGDPDGKKNTKGSSPGGEDLGVSYSLDGWKWERPPAEKDNSQIDGIIKFAIDVDDRGKVLSVSVIPGTTISDNTIVDFYKKQVLQLSFIQLDPSKTAAAISKGEVTFVIKTN